MRLLLNTRKKQKKASDPRQKNLKGYLAIYFYVYRFFVCESTLIILRRIVTYDRASGFGSERSQWKGFKPYSKPFSRNEVSNLILGQRQISPLNPGRKFPKRFESLHEFSDFILYCELKNVWIWFLVI